MAAIKLKDRVEVLEVEVARLRAKIERKPGSKVPWWDEIAGSFAGDPMFAEAMRLGREYRESQRPKSAKRKRP